MTLTVQWHVSKTSSGRKFRTGPRKHRGKSCSISLKRIGEGPVVFDMSDPRVRWMLYRYSVKFFDGEIWLAVRRQGLMFLVEQSQCPVDVEILGEIRTWLVGDKFVRSVVPLRDRTPKEMRRRAQATARHKAYRQECWRRYSIEERIQDLTGAQ
jgi:hypothetical protein